MILKWNAAERAALYSRENGSAKRERAITPMGPACVPARKGGQSECRCREKDEGNKSKRKRKRTEKRQRHSD